MHLKLCLWQLMEYSYLLDQADECEDPYMVLVYACKYSLTLSWCHSYQWNFSIEMSSKATAASINHQIGSCHVRGSVGAEKENRPLVLVTIGHSLQWDQLLQPAEEDFGLSVEDASG